MARRTTVNIVERAPADPGTSPNAYIAQVTVDMRVAFPPDTPAGDVDAAIVAAVGRLRTAARARTVDCPREYVPHVDDCYACATGLINEHGPRCPRTGKP